MTSTDTNKPAGDAGPMPDFLKRQEPPKQETKQEPPKEQEFEFHPIANVFPLMKGDEFKQFKKDIKSNKLQQPIVIYEGKILDGRNRYNACKELGLPVDTKPYIGTDPVAFVISTNVHRRHLNESQRAAIAAELATFTHGGDRSKAPIGALTDKAAAKLLNVGERSVERAKAVLKEATPNIQALVKSGEVAVSAATEVLQLPKEKQAELTDASKVREAVKQAKQAKEEAEKKAAEGDTSKLSDEIDGLVDKRRSVRFSVVGDLSVMAELALCYWDCGLASVRNFLENRTLVSGSNLLYDAAFYHRFDAIALPFYKLCFLSDD
jgi:ParB-like chromosome segregation protein Spo0J